MVMGKVASEDSTNQEQSEALVGTAARRGESGRTAQHAAQHFAVGNLSFSPQVTRNYPFGANRLPEIA